MQQISGADWHLLDLLKASFTSGNVDKLKDQLLNLYPCHDIWITYQGRAAIYYAVKLLGLKPHQKVGIPAIVCPTVIKALITADLEPVLLDVGEDLHCAPVHVPQNESDLSCVIVPHLYGLSAPIERWEEWCSQRNIKLIDDAAQSFGLRRNERILGSFGDVGILSFGPFKNLGLIRGGALLVNKHIENMNSYTNQLFAEPRRYILKRIISSILKHKLHYNAMNSFKNRKSSSIKNSYINQNVTMDNIPYLYSLSNIEAGLVTRAISRMDKYMDKKNLLAIEFVQKLNYLKNISSSGNKATTFRMFPVEVNSDMNAYECVKYLRENKIDARRIYKPLHLRYDKYKKYTKCDLVNAELCWENTFLLPNPAYLSNSLYRHLLNCMVQLDDK